MKLVWLLLLICVSQVRADAKGKKYWNPNKRVYLPYFLFGAATSAYQIEGAWDTDGKGESILDNFYHNNPEAVSDGSNGDVAADSYHNWKRDVEMLRRVGLDFYRFSISWSRVMPTGLNDNINEEGLKYYDRLINELLRYRIQPMVTMYYYDLPQHLQDLGGWTNPKIIKWFKDYATLLFERYSTKVTYWVTINNPAVCFDMYSGKMPPGLHSQGVDDYICARHMLLAHAWVYKLFNETYRPIPGVNAHIGIALNINWADPLEFNSKHDEATELYRNFSIGMFLHPIWGKGGDWPPVVKKTVAKKSREEGLEKSRLPAFSNKEIELLWGSSDFLGMNHYTTHYVSFPSKKSKPSLFNPYRDIDVVLEQGEGWAWSRAPGMRGAPYGLYKLCVYLQMNYNDPRIVITEHGLATDPGIKDLNRVDNMKEYLKASLLAIMDNVDIRGMTLFSLMDGFQWSGGYDERYGLFEVDFDSPEKTRTARLSAFLLRDVVDNRKVDDNWQPSCQRLNISERRLARNKGKDEL